MTPKEIIRRWQLTPLEPEGGFFRRIWTAPEGRGSAIHYLLAGEAISAMHRLTVDELFHYYAGTSAVDLLILHPDGAGEIRRLAAALSGEGEPTVWVPAGCWQGAVLTDSRGFAFLGTTCWPAYAEAAYEHGQTDALIAAWPEQAAEIRRRTKA
ncbi:MAG: cupin domain-containing protein [Zoogloeaceae bacterium]|jgi:predicted cupin superfamily sugar epimerase|nr:cupin domain-containing protein [Zoogloeaceae bacterium]